MYEHSVLTELLLLSDEAEYRLWAKTSLIMPNQVFHWANDLPSYAKGPILSDEAEYRLDWIMMHLLDTSTRDTSLFKTAVSTNINNRDFLGFSVHDFNLCQAQQQQELQQLKR
ncbi:hypothetical protein RND71_032200 [Anisodus tanguticus]|uniref:Uncharacterized protein n=1 Tax=Anisodus tanguticus TaxID=243964 RepID=A0AAE1RC60_9SOLA|nr:hypothetical protein RND71_032200 [Anisodus tanguticus]